MKTIAVNVDRKDTEYIERLDYERSFAKDVIQRIIESHRDDESIIESAAFKKYQQRGIEAEAEFKCAMQEIEEKYIPAFLKDHKYAWTLTYFTSKMTVEILCDCNIEG